MVSTSAPFTLACNAGIYVLALTSKDKVNRLTCDTVGHLLHAIQSLRTGKAPLPPVVLTGDPIFSVGADLGEINRLDSVEALRFARMGQDFMQELATYPGTVCAAISGYCMGGGLDMALACHHRIASPGTVFGHRGAALGLMTGWGGTQRLPRLVGKANALQIFTAAEPLTAAEALAMGLIDAVAENPVAAAIQRLSERAR